MCVCVWVFVPYELYKLETVFLWASVSMCVCIYVCVGLYVYMSVSGSVCVCVYACGCLFVCMCVCEFGCRNVDQFQIYLLSRWSQSSCFEMWDFFVLDVGSRQQNKNIKQVFWVFLILCFAFSLVLIDSQAATNELCNKRALRIIWTSCRQVDGAVMVTSLTCWE